MEGHISTLHPDGPIFRQADNTPWRLRGVTAFKLLRLFADGADLTPFLSYFRDRGANTLRLWPYVPWPGIGWVSPTNDEIIQAIHYFRSQGFYSYVTLLTSDEGEYIPWAKRLVEDLARVEFDCLLLEAGNEPRIHKTIDVYALRGVLENSGYLYTSGEYDDTALWFGRHLDAHTARDGDWPRRCHDLLEYWQGAGPHYESEPAAHVPCVAGEPMRADEANFNEQDALAYFAGCGLLGAGAIVHYENGKYGRLPDIAEEPFVESALEGLQVFPDDVWYAGGYERIDEQGGTLRTYRRGQYAVRIRPLSGPVIVTGGWVRKLFVQEVDPMMRREFTTVRPLNDTDEQRLIDMLRARGVLGPVVIGHVNSDPTHYFIECQEPAAVVDPTIAAFVN